MRVFNLVLKASGTLSDHILVDEVSIYRDNDGDGTITEADSRIAGPAGP